MRGWARRAVQLLCLAGAGIALPASPALAAGAGVPVSAQEAVQFSGEVASFDQAQSATIDWGDQTQADIVQTVPGNDGRSHVIGAHTYAEGGAYTITVTGVSCPTVQDQFCSHQTVTAAATVSDPSLSGSGGQLSGVAGHSTAGILARFTDADPQTTPGEYTASIDWGDGASGAGSLTADGSGGYAVSGSHLYASAGSYAVRVQITDAGGAGLTTQGRADIAGVPVAGPRARFAARPSTVAPGAPLTLDASPSRPDGTPVGRYEWSLDGHTVAVCDGRTSQLDTKLVDPGTHRFDLTVIDSSGHATSSSGEVTVTGGRATDRSGRAARVIFHPVRADPVFVCAAGARDPVVAIESPDNRAAGAGCSTQLEAGIAEAMGCFELHPEQLDVLVQHLRNTSTITSVLLTVNTTLPGIPHAESVTYEDDIASFFFRARAADFCTTVPASARYEYCNVPPGAGSLAPPSTYCSDPTNEKDPTCLGGGAVGGPPPPGGTKPHTSADARGAAAGSGGHAITGAELLTPCTRDTVDPGNGASVIEHPCVQPWVSSTPVVINGLRYDPAPGAVILVSPEFHLVISSRASVWFGRIRLHADHPINLQVPETATGPTADFPDLTVPEVTSLLSAPGAAGDAARRPADQGGVASLGGFVTSPGSLHVGFDSRVTVLSFQVDLPFPINDGSGHHATAQVRVQVDPDGSTHVLDAGVRGITVFLGPLQVKDFSACWRLHAGTDNPCPSVTGISPDPRPGTTGFWDATGEVDYGSVALVFRPSPEGFPPICGSSLYGIGFDGGHLDFAGAGLTAGATGIPIGPITLDRLAARFQSSDTETEFCAYAQFRAASILHFDAQLLALWEKGGATRTLTGADLPGLPVPATVSHFALGASGVVTVSVPVVGDLRLGDGYALYRDAPSNVIFGAHVGFGLGDDDNGIGVDGRVDGGITLGGGYPFWLEGQLHAGAHAKACFTIFCAEAHLDVRGDAIISHGYTKDHHDGGIAVCGTASAGGGILGVDIDIHGSGEAKYHWGESVGHFLAHGLHAGGGCDFVDDLRLAARDAAGPLTVQVGPGAQAVDLYLDGTNGSPNVRLTGPGVDLTTQGRANVVASGAQLIRFSDPFKLTDVFLRRPRPGIYRITPVTGSPGVADLRRADGVTPHVSAEVTGRGLRRQLHFRVITHPGQRIDFRELSRREDRAIGSSQAAHGVISFAAAAGYDRRRIVAEVVQNGLAVQRLTVAAYVPTPPRKLGRVTRLRTVRRGTRIIVSFRALRGAQAYRIVLATRDGVRTVRVVRGGRTTFTGVLAEYGGRLAVTALGDGSDTLDGPPVVAGLRAAIRRT